MKLNLFTLFVVLAINALAFLTGFTSIYLAIFNTLLVILLIYINFKRKNKLQSNALELSKNLNDLASLINELSLENHYLYNSSNEQSDAIQESASSVEETSSMAEQTAIQTNQSNVLVIEIDNIAQSGSNIMGELGESIDSINLIKSEIENIQDIILQVSDKTRLIDEIVFNTKLLSFNASIEAERAGTHGAGFSVVAQEIGKLANSSGEAAKDIRSILQSSNSRIVAILDDTKSKIDNGKNVSQKVITNFQTIADKISHLQSSIQAIASATKEQEIGIKQISKSMSKMDISANENVKVAHNTELLSAKIEDGLSELFSNIGEMVTSTGSAAQANTTPTAGNFINWSDKLSLNIELIDNQHKQLVDIVNELFRAIRSGQTNEKLNSIFDGLINYTATHFETEEEIFDKIHYFDIESHKQHHKTLVESALKLQADFHSGNAVIGREVMDFLKSWLLDHIAQIDRQYVKDFKKNGIK